jgi:hypothetical protein
VPSALRLFKSPTSISNPPPSLRELCLVLIVILLARTLLDPRKTRISPRKRVSHRSGYLRCRRAVANNLERLHPARLGRLDGNACLGRAGFFINCLTEPLNPGIEGKSA